jgi:hypothetical protein
MVYKPLVPLITDRTAQSAIDFRENFLEMGRLYRGDHEPLRSDNSDHIGHHRKVTLPEQAADPTTAASEMAVYTKDNSGVTDLYMRAQSDGDVSQIVSSGGISVGGLVLRAFALFDYNGNIIKITRKDDDGEDEEVPIAFNIKSIVHNFPPVTGVSPGRCNWTLTYNTNMPDADYIWSVQTFADTNFTGAVPVDEVVQAQPEQNGTYGNVVTTSTFKILGYASQSPQTLGTFGRIDLIQFQAFTVA